MYVNIHNAADLHYVLLSQFVDIQTKGFILRNEYLNSPIACFAATAFGADTNGSLH